MSVASRPIGYYVHHHGDGHRQRALAIAGSSLDLMLLGTGLAGRTNGVPFIDLAEDRMKDGAFDGRDHSERPASLHYAPIDHEGVRGRVAQIAGWIRSARPALMVVDVSVEVAMLARLASVPTVYVRLSGHRVDPPHLDAYRGAAALLAPFHPDLDDDRTPKEVRERTFYAPGIGRKDQEAVVQNDLILVVLGRGGPPSDGANWAAAAAALPGMRWRVIGPCAVPPQFPSNVEFHAWVDNPSPMIASAAVIVGGAGDGLVSSVIAHRRPFICLPEDRPFEEQVSKAIRLSAIGGAIVCERHPEQSEWPQLVRRALGQDPSVLASLDASDGAERAACWLRKLADETSFESRRIA
jgi:hypothetical protein